MVRRQAHELVVFYVNRLAVQQSKINVRFVKVLSRLVERLYGSSVESDISELRMEVNELKERIKALEEASAGTSQNRRRKR